MGHEALPSLQEIAGILGPFPIEFGFPRPDWARLRDWIESQCVEGRREAAGTHLARQWIELIREAAGDGYEIAETENFLVLCSAGRASAGSLGRIGEKALKAMLDGLPGIVRKLGYGKLVCLAFGSSDAYYDYISHFDPEGRFGASAGCCIRRGYDHFVLNRGDLWLLERVLVHELTHACLSTRRLPLWLEEGVTQSMEESILGHSDFAMDREKARRHREYWTTHGLRRFWRGRSFHQPDEGQELSYALAQVLIRNVLSRGREKLLRLMKEADFADSGDGAVRRIYGLGIGDLAAQFLGDGDWDHGPVDAADFYERALLQQEHGDYRSALEDFRMAVE